MEIEGLVIGCECVGLLAARPVGKEKSFLSFNVPPVQSV